VQSGKNSARLTVLGPVPNFAQIAGSPFAGGGDPPVGELSEARMQR
jgi:hypothetical protein